MVADIGEIGELISIHAPYAGSDTESIDLSASGMVFQSTLPMQGATADLAQSRK